MAKELTVDEARETPLMGQPGSWDGYSRKPMDVAPDGTLKKARSFFSKLLREEQPKESRERLRHQVECIDLVLEFHAANSPQTTLF
jgi:hypothetical protein